MAVADEFDSFLGFCKGDLWDLGAVLVDKSVAVGDAVG